MIDLNDYTAKNWIDKAFEHYSNPQMDSLEDFKDDIKRLKYLKRLCIKYQKSGVLSERLILNHIIILSNVFPPPTAFDLITQRLRKYLFILKPFLIYANIWNSHRLSNPDNECIIMDMHVVKKLRELNK